VSTIENFKSSLSGTQPPGNLSVYLKALWYDAKGNWDTAHHMIDNLEDLKAYWVHAYLHRKEGDLWNAEYWYKKAGELMPDYSLQKEWEEIVSALL
jgi:hypothetical protein